MIRYEDDCCGCDYPTCSGCPYQTLQPHVYCDNCGEELGDYNYDDIEDAESYSEHYCNDCFYEINGYYRDANEECEVCGELFRDIDIYTFVSHDKQTKMRLCDDCYDKVEADDDEAWEKQKEQERLKLESKVSYKIKKFMRNIWK